MHLGLFEGSLMKTPIAISITQLN